MARGIVSNITRLKNLKCFSKYGYANGYFRDELERRTLKLMPYPCGACAKTQACMKKTATEAEVTKAEQMLIVYGLFEIQGVTARALKNLQNTCKDKKGKRLSKGSTEKVGCFGQYGFGTGYFMEDKEPFCEHCSKEPECFKESAKGLKGGPLLSRYVANIEKGARR